MATRIVHCPGARSRSQAVPSRQTWPAARRRRSACTPLPSVQLLAEAEESPAAISAMHFPLALPPSPGNGGSHASPIPSLSTSSWRGFGTHGQLSQRSPTSSPSPSSWNGLKSSGQLSAGRSFLVSGSGNTSSKLPSPSRSRKIVRWWVEGEMKARP